MDGRSPMASNASYSKSSASLAQASHHIILPQPLHLASALDTTSEVYCQYRYSLRSLGDMLVQIIATSLGREHLKNTSRIVSCSFFSTHPAVFPFPTNSGCEYRCKRIEALAIEPFEYHLLMVYDPDLSLAFVLSFPTRS